VDQALALIDDPEAAKDFLDKASAMAHYAQRVRADTETSVAGFIRVATGTEKAGRAAHVSANTGVPEWYTPPEYIEAARAVRGEIDLDPASSDIAQKTVKALHYFTLDDDGLNRRGQAGYG
jgi:ParB family chromosome partitioning protein